MSLAYEIPAANPVRAESLRVRRETAEKLAAIAHVPHAKDLNPWFEAGQGKSDFGTLFAYPAACGQISLWFDRACERSFACLIPAGELAPQAVVQNRRFDVNTDKLRGA